jgi:hypothetical protein
MKAKEKAKELIDKVKEATTYEYQEYAGARYTIFEHDIEELKQCALIAVDEILSIELLNDTLDDYYLRYWKEVKQEILTYGGNK